MNNQSNEQIKNQLILTSSEKIVLDNYKFLGTWSSKTYSKNICKYHLDDEKNFNKFVSDLDNYYTEIINEVILALKKKNLFSQFDNFQVEFLFGFFLKKLITPLYERWVCIDSFLQENDETYFVENIEFETKNFNSYDSHTFFKFFGDNDEWNYKIYKEIIQFTKTKKIKFFQTSRKQKSSFKEIKYIESWRTKINKFLFKLFNKSNHLSYLTYMNRVNEIKLNFKTSKIPCYILPTKISYCNINKFYERKIFDDQKNTKINFKFFFLNFFEKYAPSIFFEDFDFFYKKNKDINFEGKTILTSIGHYHDFNFLLNIFKTKNIDLNIIQHGSDNIFLKFFSEFLSIDLKFAKKYFVYTKNLQHNISNLRYLNSISSTSLIKKKKVKNIKGFTIVTPPLKSYRTQINSNFFGKNFDFLRNSILELENYFSKNNINYKIKPAIYDNDKSDLENILKIDILKNIKCKISVGKNTQNRIFILTYIGTPVFELVKKNIPFIIFANKKQIGNHVSYDPLLDNLKKKNILFYNFEDLKFFLDNHPTDDLNDWWNKESTNTAKREISNTLCKAWYDKKLINNFLNFNDN
jgi:putative transferase (TIGR04331 family)